MEVELPPPEVRGEAHYIHESRILGPGLWF